MRVRSTVAVSMRWDRAKEAHARRAPIADDPQKPTERDDWRVHGLWFGYPTCCIDAFCNLEHVGGPRRKLWGTGYVPCADCNELPEDELVRRISERRIAPIPFPKGSF